MNMSAVCSAETSQILQNFVSKFNPQSVWDNDTISGPCDARRESAWPPEFYDTLHPRSRSWEEYNEVDEAQKRCSPDLIKMYEALLTKTKTSFDGDDPMFISDRFGLELLNLNVYNLGKIIYDLPQKASEPERSKWLSILRFNYDEYLLCTAAVKQNAGWTREVLYEPPRWRTSITASNNANGSAVVTGASAAAAASSTSFDVCKRNNENEEKKVEQVEYVNERCAWFRKMCYYMHSRLVLSELCKRTIRMSELCALFTPFLKQTPIHWELKSAIVVDEVVDVVAKKKRDQLAKEAISLLRSLKPMQASDRNRDNDGETIVRDFHVSHDWAHCEEQAIQNMVLVGLLTTITYPVNNTTTNSNFVQTRVEWEAILNKSSSEFIADIDETLHSEIPYCRHPTEIAPHWVKRFPFLVDSPCTESFTMQRRMKGVLEDCALVRHLLDMLSMPTTEIWKTTACWIGCDTSDMRATAAAALVFLSNFNHAKATSVLPPRDANTPRMFDGKANPMWRVHMLSKMKLVQEMFHADFKFTRRYSQHDPTTHVCTIEANDPSPEDDTSAWTSLHPFSIWHIAEGVDRSDRASVRIERWVQQHPHGRIICEMLAMNDVEFALAITNRSPIRIRLYRAVLIYLFAHM